MPRQPHFRRSFRSAQAAAPSNATLYCVSKVWITLQDDLTSISPPVLSTENDCVDDYNHDDQNIHRDACPDTGSELWAILRAEDGTASDATD